MWVKVVFVLTGFFVGDLLQLFLLQIEPNSLSIQNILIAGISAVSAGLVFLFFLYTKQNKEFQKALENNAERTEKIYQTTVRETNAVTVGHSQAIKDLSDAIKALPRELKQQLRD